MQNILTIGALAFGLLLTSCSVSDTEPVEEVNPSPEAIQDVQIEEWEEIDDENQELSNTWTLTEQIEEETNQVVPYTFYTENNELVNIYPIWHATAVVEWWDTTMYIDPAEEIEKYDGFPSPDMIFITHIHGDHLQQDIVESLYQEDTQIIVPASVNDELNSNLWNLTTIMERESTLDVDNFTITAVPAYNIREEALSFHPESRNDNGYIIESDGFRVYFSWDSEDTPEMRALSDIDVAFISMNLPFTMDVLSAADAVLEFQPETVFPYHYRGRDEVSDIENFQNIVNAQNPNIEVILHDWYAWE